MAARIKAYANCDHAFVAWRLDAPVPECRGFALRRRRGANEDVAGTWVGFEGQPAAPGTIKPSTEWPVQKYSWADLGVHPGDVVSYQAVPMVGKPGALTAAEDEATPWSDELTVEPHGGEGLAAYFNRGIVASQWLSRRLQEKAPGHEGTALKTEINDPKSPIRAFLGGPLRDRMLGLLDEIKAAGGHAYAALFELDDPELVPRLTALGDHAHVVLANGSDPGEDENAPERGALKAAGVEVHDRMVHSGHLAHNKFLVVSDADDKPQRAWTGSTNWSKTGLCTQANNGIEIASPTVAAQFRTQWDNLREAGDAYPPALLDANDERKDATVQGQEVDTWFVAARDEVDLVEARGLIAAAKQGILFLMFNPGPVDTLLNAIVDRNTEGTPTYDGSLYIHGVLNQDPSTAAHPISLFHRGEQEDANFDVVLPAAITDQLGTWVKELKQMPGTFAMVHSKVIVLDPFGETPIVMTGSHNLGPKASGSNDDNLVIIHGAPELAAAYAVNIIGVYNQYRWRFWRTQNPSDDWTGLQDNDTWQDDYFTGARARELSFWLGEG